MNPTIQAILFDLGDTLMYSQTSWPPVFDQAGRELARALHKSGIHVDINTFHIDFRLKLDEYYVERDRNLYETSTMDVLKKLLAEKGYVNIPKQILRESLDQFYAVTQQNWMLENDAHPTLSILKNNGLHLGLVSNAGDTRDVLQLVGKFGIQPYFDFVITSADCGYRKPHPQIFELALARWGYMPDEIAMVGDRLEADVRGAQPLGIFTIWVTRRAKKPENQSIQPNATVNTLGEIPSILLNPSQTNR